MLVVRGLTRPGLEPASFELDDGECIAVRGPSGSGKTLLLRAIADLDPNAGEVRLDGRPRESIPAPQWRRLIRYLAAEPGWWGEIVGEHFVDWSAAAPIVEQLGLPPEARDWPVARLSTGERQRLALIRGLECVPRVLLLDEPTAALDAVATEAVERLIAARRRDGAAVLWVTHDPAQAGRVAGRVLGIADGRLRAVAA